jgi:lysyl-tRNA synthetase class 2
MAEVDRFMQTILGCPAAEQISYQQLFLKTVNIDPLQRDLKQLQQYVVASGILASDPHDLGYDTLLDLVFSHQIEPALGQHKPVLVYGYPASQSALAKINADDERIADRFELYYKGVELANGFNELTNSTEQAARFEHDNTQRQDAGLPTMPADINLIAALSSGLPNCAGVALGLDRLLMLKLGVSHIYKVIAFPSEIA